MTSHRTAGLLAGLFIAASGCGSAMEEGAVLGEPVAPGAASGGGTGGTVQPGGVSTPGTGAPGIPSGAETLAWPATFTPTGQTYYLSPSGDDANAGTSPEAPWKTLAKAARTLRAGDTLLMRGGSHASPFFQPASSGTRDNPITVKAYPGEVPVLTGSPTFNTFFNIIGRSWIVIEGLEFAGTTGGIHVNANAASYLIIRRNAFRNHGGETMINIGASDHVLIEHNTFDTTGDPAGPGEGNHIYLMGTSHSVVQGNYFTRAGHYAVDLINYGLAADQRYSHHNVVRHNTIEQHWGGGIGLIRGSFHNLVEHNRILYVGEGVDYPKVGIQVAAEKNVVRRNVVGWASTVPHNDSGMAIFAYSFAGVVQNARLNRIYNNVVYKSGRSAIDMNQKDSSVNTGNKVVNNILYFNRVGGPREAWWPAGNYYLTVETFHAFADNKWAGFPNGNSFLHNIMLHADAAGDRPGEDPFVFYEQENWGHSLAWVQTRYPAAFQGNLERNPGFVDADGGDFRLRTGSAAVDAGAHLTQARAGGAATTTVPVDDAYFFTDGYGVVAGDLVRIGGNGPVRVTAVDYAGGTLTVAAAVSFAPGDPVSLDYAGAAPDLGAFESR